MFISKQAPESGYSEAHNRVKLRGTNFFASFYLIHRVAGYPGMNELEGTEIAFQSALSYKSISGVQPSSSDGLRRSR